MSKHINPLDHVSRPLYSSAELIMKQVCPGPCPKTLGEVSLDKEVPTHKMFSLYLSRNLMVRGMPREKPLPLLKTRYPSEFKGGFDLH